jgi:3-dehydroquinate synthetase
MAADKKARAGSLRWVLTDQLGSAVVGCEVPEETLAEAWNVIGQ